MILLSADEEVMRTGRCLQIIVQCTRLVVLTLTVLFALTPGVRTRTALAEHGTGSGQSFTVLEAGFVQEIVGASSHFMGGVAFAPDGDVWVNDCRDLGVRHLHRYDLQGVAPEVNGTPLHPESIVPSNVGCGMTNHPDGFIYSNTAFGIVQVDASTGAPTGKIFGPPGNGFGITPDPQTGDLVYAAQNCDQRVSSTGVCDIITVNPNTEAFSIFLSLTGFNDLIDGVYFHPDGSQLFLAKLLGFAATVVDRDFPGARTGTFNRDIVLPSQPDGIAFHESGFVVTTNLDGTISKIVLGPPDVVSVFASGGGRNDLLQVGSDGCLYTTQDFLTRYDDGTETDQSSVVRICPNFVPPPGVKVLEHFMFYKTKTTRGTSKFIKFGPVTFADQFGSADYNIITPKRLGLPSNKNAEGVQDDTTHLTEYQIKPAMGQHRFQKRANVQIVNQCNDLLLEVIKPESILIPTKKRLREPDRCTRRK